MVFSYNNFLAIFSISTEEDDMRVRLFDPNGNTVYNKENSKNIKIAYTAIEAGNHQLCIENYNRNDKKINFEFLTGVAAKDYSDVAKKSNLKPIELNLQKLEDMISYLVHELSSVMAHEESTLALNDALSNKIILFSMLTLVSMVTVGIFETVFIQKYLQRRKLI